MSGILTTEFAYNGAGDRVAKTVDGVTTDYVLDGSTGLTTGLLAQHDSGTWAYHINDGLGSVRQLADPQGQVVASYSFSPFGVPLGESGGEPYGFTGEQWDASAGLVYLRARYYDPAVGRFLTRDPWPGVAQRPMSLQPYVYASDNPVKYIDPAGLYNCLTGKQWAPELIGLCLLFDTSPVARNLLYQNGIVPVLSVVGWQDARIMFEHWLDGEGETMEFGSRLIRLIERDTAPLIEESRARYLSDAAQLMRGKAGRLPSRSYTSFLSNSVQT